MNILSSSLVHVLDDHLLYLEYFNNDGLHVSVLLLLQTASYYLYRLLDLPVAVDLCLHRLL